MSLEIYGGKIMLSPFLLLLQDKLLCFKVYILNENLMASTSRTTALHELEKVQNSSIKDV